MNPLGPDVATIRTSAVSSFRMEAMAAGGFAGEYERWMDMADLPTEEEEKELIATLFSLS